MNTHKKTHIKKTITKFASRAAIGLFLLAGALSLGACGEEESSGDFFTFWMTISPIRNYGPYYYNYTSVTDLKDGTIRIKQESGGRLYMDVRVKKCAQGQVYRETENDCRGTGSELDNFGAHTYQYCDTNTNACNDAWNRLNSTAHSQADASCAADNTAGRTWRVVYADVAEKIQDLSDASRTKIFPELPAGQFWTNYARDASTANYMTLSGEKLKGFASKTESRLVLCQDDAGEADL